MIGSSLKEYVRARQLERVIVETSFVLTGNPDTVRIPDVAFVRAEQ